MPVFGTYWSGLADGALSDAGKVGITDTEGAYTSTNVDGALDEIAAGTTLDARYEPLQLIERKTLASVSGTGANITFSSIPQTFSDLVLSITAKGATTSGEVHVRFNDDTGSNYDSARVGHTSANASSVGANAGATRFVLGFIGDNGLVGRYEVPAYTATVVNKALTGTQVLLASTAPHATTQTFGGQWRSTAAVTRIDIIGNFSSGLAVGSVLSLYGRP